MATEHWSPWVRAVTGNDIPEGVTTFGGHSVTFEQVGTWRWSAEVEGEKDPVTEVAWLCSCGSKGRPYRGSERQAHAEWRNHVARKGGLEHLVREARP